MSEFNEKAEIMQALCLSALAGEGKRYEYTAPFRVGPFIWATDAAMVARWKTSATFAGLVDSLDWSGKPLPPVQAIGLDEPRWENDPVRPPVVAPLRLVKCTADSGDDDCDDGAELNPIVEIPGLPTASRRRLIILLAAGARLFRPLYQPGTEPIPQRRRFHPIKFMIGADITGLLMPVNDPTNRRWWEGE